MDKASPEVSRDPSALVGVAQRLAQLRQRLAPAAALGRTMAFRVAALYIAIFLVIAVAAGGLVYRRVADALSAQLLDAVATEADTLAATAAAVSPEQLATLVDARAQPGKGRLYLLVGPLGDKRAGNLTRWPAELGTVSGGTFRFAGPGEAEATRLAAGVVRALPGGTALLVGRDVDRELAVAGEIRLIIIAAFACLAIAGVLGAIAAGHAVRRRIARMTGTSETIMSGDLSRRLPVTGSDDELDDLARSFNAMLDRIEQLMAGMREVSDNIAHDLRTPLGRLRARAEAALAASPADPRLRDSLDLVIEEADGLIRTFDALLLIARLEAGALDGKVAALDLAELAHDLADLYAPVAEEAGLALVCEAKAAVVVDANRQLVGQALANMIDNAIKYAAPSATRDRARATIDVRVDDTGEEGRIVVADHGPGIPAADRDRALKRFVRLDQSRTKPGSGLGLSLVAAVARLHRGRVALGDNHPGLRIELLIPKRAATAPDGPTDAAEEQCQTSTPAPALSGSV